jgi:hypothetical protein
MADLLYREAGQLIAPDADFKLRIVNPELWEPLKAFDANIERARAFWRVHPYLLEHAVVGITRLVNATYELTGKPFLRDPQQDRALADFIKARLTAQFEKRLAETGSIDMAAGYDFERALRRFEMFIESDPNFEREVFGTFLSQIVATWTAFETLAGDLWRAILACDPEAVANPDTHSFQSLEKLRKAYTKLLPRSQKIDAILSTMELRKLNLVRNVALHRAGRADQKYFNYARDIGWDVPDELDEPLRLDGVRVRNLLNPVIQASIDLIGAVDGWITLERQGSKGKT